MPWFYYVAKAIVRVLLVLLTRWEIRGRENIPDRGPLLVAANHVNLTDSPVLCVSLSRRAMFMAKEELFRSRFSAYFMRSFGAFPVHRGRVDRVAFRTAEQLLAQGLALVMFPEGGRSKNAQLQTGLSGSALIAQRSGAPILPVGIAGTKKIKGIVWLFRRPQITINIGTPFSLPQVDGKLTKEELAQSTDFIMEHIAELLPTEYRGEYAGKKL